MMLESYIYHGSGEFAPHTVGIKERYYEIPNEATLDLFTPEQRESWMDQVGLIGTVTIKPSIIVHNFDPNGAEKITETNSFPPPNDFELGGVIVSSETIPLNLPQLIKDRIKNGKFTISPKLAQHIKLS